MTSKKLVERQGVRHRYRVIGGDVDRAIECRFGLQMSFDLSTTRMPQPQQNQPVMDRAVSDPVADQVRAGDRDEQDCQRGDDQIDQKPGPMPLPRLSEKRRPCREDLLRGHALGVMNVDRWARPQSREQVFIRMCVFLKPLPDLPHESYREALRILPAGLELPNFDLQPASKPCV